MRLQAWIGFCFTVVLSVIGTGGGAWAEEIVLGGMCDRTGPTKNIGLQACHGVLDYIKLVNAKGASKVLLSATSRSNMPLRLTEGWKPTSA
jgi:hypothetical protein